MQEFYKRKNGIIQTLCLLALFGMCHLSALTQDNYASLPIDTLIVRIPSVMRSDEAAARLMIETLEKKSLHAQHRHGIVQTAFFKCWLKYRHESTEVAIKAIDSALHNIRGINTDTICINFYILKGQCYVRQTHYDSAITSFRQALKIAESRNDQIGKNNVLLSIGWVYMEDKQSREAIHIFEELLKKNPSPQYENRTILLNNIAACYNGLQEFQHAEQYARQGIEAARFSHRNPDLANGLNILAHSCYKQGKTGEAVDLLKQAASVREKASDLAMLSADYIELANLYTDMHQPDQAITWALKAENIAKKNNILLKQVEAYRILASSYEQKANWKEALRYSGLLVQYQDSLKKEEYQQSLANMQAQYETQKKIAENLELKKDVLETNLINVRQQRWLILLAAALLLSVISAWYVYKLLKSRFNNRLAREQLNEQKRISLAVMDAQENERRHISADLHDGVGQMLSAASIQLNKQGLPGQTKLQELLDKAYTELRYLSHQITPEIVLQHGLENAIRETIGNLNDAGKQPRFTLYTHIEQPLHHTIAALCLYRCFQECCTNVIKHAQATQVAVHLNAAEETVELIMEDNGIGFDKAALPNGLGLQNIRNRIAVFKGELIADSLPGKGTTMIIRIHYSFFSGIS